MIFNKTDWTKPNGTQRPVFKDLPPGLYTVRISAEETKPTKAGNGEYLQLTFEIVEGPHKGTKIFDRLNLRNPSARAMEIAQATLGAICEAAGVTDPSDSSALVGSKLRIATLNESYQDKVYPRIRSYSAVSESAEGTLPEGDSAEYLDDLPF